jgi:hypothetical protein
MPKARTKPGRHDPGALVSDLALGGIWQKYECGRVIEAPWSQDTMRHCSPHTDVLGSLAGAPFLHFFRSKARLRKSVVVASCGILPRLASNVEVDSRAVTAYRYYV